MSAEGSLSGSGDTRATDRGGTVMRFEVPAGTALVFSGPDGALLPVPQVRSLSRTIEVEPED